MIVVSGGQNDYGQPMPKVLHGIDETCTTLRKFNPDARIIAVSPTAPGGDAPPQLVRMRDEIQAVSKRIDAEFVDATTPNWLADPALIGPDHAHPTNAGHALYARRLVRQIR